jgi:hypothetical protein
VICNVTECIRKVHRRGMCQVHYNQWRLENRDQVRYQRANEPVNERFWRQVQGDGADTCWTWIGTTDRDGYGKIVVHGQWISAHRFAYEALRAEIPAGLQIDHLCRNRACVNPWHLEPVTHRVNQWRRNFSLDGRPLHSDTHCPSGHARNEVNLYVSAGGVRSCRACNRAAQRRRRARIKAVTR